MEEQAAPTEPSPPDPSSTACKQQVYRGLTVRFEDAETEATDGSDGRRDGVHYHLNTPQLHPGGPAVSDRPSSPVRLPRVEPLSERAEKWLSEDINTDADVQSLIRRISRDAALSPSEKNRLCQLIHSHRFHQRRKREEQQLRKDLDRRGREVSYSNVWDPKTKERMLGCEHYPRFCKLKAACCGIWVVCRQCHDRDEMGHAMDRFATKEVMCMRCGLIQGVSEKCTGCHKEFASYFCRKCKFYDNTPGKAIYHCNDCKICRVGKGIGVDNFHCKRCDACVSEDYAKNHRCLEKSLDANCPICGQYLFTSTKPVVFMRCGHTMHSHCFDAYTAKHYTCPLCHKALTNMKAYYRQLDAELKRQQMPEEHRNKLSEVLCYDCDQRSHTAYHFYHHKCTECGSYNTRTIKTFRPGEGSSDAASASASGAGPDTALIAPREGEPGN